ncbi:MAG: hypothetical protein J2O49_09515 [Sciscionella sp.]|nr:hypothetical protein [Sciscionella sp.]
MIGWERCPDGTITGWFADYEIRCLRSGALLFLRLAGRRQREWTPLYPFGAEIGLSITDGPSRDEGYEGIVRNYFDGVPEPIVRLREQDFVRMGIAYMNAVLPTLPRERGQVWIRTPRQVRAWSTCLKIIHSFLHWYTLRHLEHYRSTPTGDGTRTMLEAQHDFLDWLCRLAKQLDELARAPRLPTGDPRLTNTEQKSDTTEHSGHNLRWWVIIEDGSGRTCCAGYWDW